MAIFYKHIKGCGENTLNNETSHTTGGWTEDTQKDLWTWIKFADFEKYNDGQQDNCKFLPNIIVATDLSDYTDDKKYKDLGKIVTSNALGQSIDEKFTFNNSVNFVEGKNGVKVDFGIPQESSKNYTTSAAIKFKGTIEDGLQKYFTVQGSENNLLITFDGSNPNFVFKQSSTELFKIMSSYIEMSNIHATKSIFVNQNYDTSKSAGVYINGIAEATYFNATSDKRAKSNIRKSEFNALDIVKSLPIYNFTYNSTQTPSIGIIAQEAQNIDIEDFSIVRNKEATGENGDYMTIRESKLIYVLWKAIQEQQEEIEELKAQLNRK